MELLLLVFFCLLTGSEVTFGAGPEIIRVKEGGVVTLPCSLNTTDITNKKFVWKKDGRQVFLYDAGDHSNIVNTGQDQQFRGRVEHLPTKLKSGNASIIISDTKVSDSGEYTCDFTDLQPRQIFYVKLIVFVKASQPSVRILNQKGKSAELQCEVRAAFPKPELHWEDGDGNKLPADEPQESERGGLYDIILQTTVYTTDHYRCLATQKEINHQTHDETYVSVPVLTGGEIAAIVIGLLLLVAVGIVVYKYWDRIKSRFLNAEAKPSVKIVEQTDKSALLVCEVRGAFPKPELHWQDSEGYKLPAADLHETVTGGRYNITLQTIVTKTDIYRCVATQEEINHHTYAYIYVHFTEKTVVRADEGSDVILPCSLPENIINKKFEWKRGGHQVFLYDKGNVNSQTQDKQFRGEHFRDELKSGIASIIIRKVTVDDSGDYTCEFPDLQPRQIFHIKLVYEPTVVRAEEGRDVILPCSLSPEDITKKKFEWTKNDRFVFLYDDGSVNDNNSQTQDKQFKGRVSYFPDELKSGNASITIRNTKAADTGNYTCEFPDLQPRQIFHIKFVFEPAAPTAVTAPGKGSAQDRKKTAPTTVTAPGKGSAKDPKKTDGGDVEAGLSLMPLNRNQPPNEDSRF